MKKRNFLVAMAMTAVMLMSGCGGGGGGDEAASGDQSFTCSLGSVAAETSNQIEAARMFADKVAEYTDGTVTINVFPGGQIGSDESMAEDLERGNLEFAFLNQGSCAGLDQMFDFHYLPYIARDYDEADALYYGDGVVPTTLKETFAKHNMQVLGWYENEYRGLSNSKHEVATVDDIKGMKLRVPGSAAIKGYFEAAGAQTVTIAMPELYTALQQGTVDGQDNGILITHDNKLEEKNEYYTYTRHVYAMSGMVASNAIWEQFSDAQKDAILKAAAETQEWQVAESRNQIADYMDEMAANGVTFTELTDEQLDTFVQVAEGVWEDMKAVYGEDKIDALKAEVAALRGE